MRKFYIFIMLSLSICLFIYSFYRIEKTVINLIIINIFSVDTYATLRKAVTNQLPLNETIIYSLPEGLWVFCITLTSKPFYLSLYNRQVSCVLVPLLYCIGLELFQLFHFTNGRFDPIDILMAIGFWGLANYSFNYNSHKANIFKPVNIKSMICFASYGIVYLSYVFEK